jgi:hypothetical protein
LGRASQGRSTTWWRALEPGFERGYVKSICKADDSIQVTLTVPHQRKPDDGIGDGPKDQANERIKLIARMVSGIVAIVSKSISMLKI